VTIGIRPTLPPVEEEEEEEELALAIFEDALAALPVLAPAMPVPEPLVPVEAPSDFDPLLELVEELELVVDDPPPPLPPPPGLSERSQEALKVTLG
jgi:hypothetical protein